MGRDVLAGSGFAAPGAQALGFSWLQAAPDDTSAGAHSDFHVSIGFTTPGDDIKDLTIHLPPGMIGDPTATPLCTAAELNGDTCPAASQVGTVSTTVAALGLLPLTVDGSIYNLEAMTGEPARFGIVLRPAGGVLPKITMQSGAQLRQSDFGLDTVLKDIPNTASGLPIDIQSMSLTLSGSAGSPPQPFMRNPTSCGTATTVFDATSYAHPDTTVSGQASFTPTNCAALPFSPTLRAQIGSVGTTTPPAKPPLTTTVLQDEGEAGLKSAQVVLPSGIGADNNVLNHQCQMADFQAGTCPPNSIVGSVRATSPLLTSPLKGKVALVVPPLPPRLGLDLKGELSMQIFGSFVFTPNGPGNLFDKLPDIPISTFTLKFKANRLITSTRDLCKLPKPRFKTEFHAFSGAVQTGDVATRVIGCPG